MSITSRGVTTPPFARAIGSRPDRIGPASVSQAAGGIHFTMTAGQIPATTWGGFQRGDFGSIDREPIDGTTLNFCATDQSGGSISFEGDIRETLSGKNLFVDGQEYAATWDLSGGDTYSLIASRIFFYGEVYFVEIK